MDEPVEGIAKKLLPALPRFSVPEIFSVQKMPRHFHMDQDGLVSGKVDENILASALGGLHSLAHYFFFEISEISSVLYRVLPSAFRPDMIVRPDIFYGKFRQNLVQSRNSSRDFRQFGHWNKFKI